LSYMAKGFILTMDAVLSLLILLGAMALITYEKPLDFSDMQIRQEKIDLGYACYLINDLVTDCHKEFYALNVTFNNSFDITR